MGACVSKFNGLSGSQGNPPESRDLKTEEKNVKGEVAAADGETERRSLGYLFKEKNQGEVPAESSSKEATVVHEEKMDEFIPIQIVEDSVKDEKEKSPISDETHSKPLEDVKLSSQNVEAEECLKKTEGTDIAKADEEKHGVVGESGKDTGRNEEQEPVLPAEKGEAEVKLADIETEDHGEDEPASELPQTTKLGDESAKGMQPETLVMVIQDQQPEADEGGKEVQPSEPTNALASENKSETLIIKQNTEEEQIQDLVTDTVEKLAETSTLEKTGTKEQAEMILPPLDAEKQKTEDSLVDTSNMETSQKVTTEHSATEKSMENIEKEKNNDNKNPESSVESSKVEL